MRGELGPGYGHRLCRISKPARRVAAGDDGYANVANVANVVEVRWKRSVGIARHRLVATVVIDGPWGVLYSARRRWKARAPTMRPTASTHRFQSLHLRSVHAGWQLRPTPVRCRRVQGRSIRRWLRDELPPRCTESLQHPQQERVQHLARRPGRPRSDVRRSRRRCVVADAHSEGITGLQLVKPLLRRRLHLRSPMTAVIHLRLGRVAWH